MKKFVCTLMALAGAVISTWAAASLLVTGQPIYGYHAVYAGLVGIALLSFGLIGRQD